MDMNFDLVPEAICFIDKATLSMQHANSKFCKTVAPINKFKGLDFLENFVSKEDHARFHVGIERVLELEVLFRNNFRDLFYRISKRICENGSFRGLKSSLQETKNGIEEADRTSDSTDTDPWKQTPVIRDCNTLALGSRQVSLLFHIISARKSISINGSHCIRNDYPIWRRYDWALAFDSKSECIVLSGRMMTVVSAEKEALEKVRNKMLAIKPSSSMKITENLLCRNSWTF
jgi:hypothetical protein